MKKECRIIALANQKGGTAKTTTACNLGFCLSKAGYDVLMIDFDPQANLSMSCGIEQPDKLKLTVAEILNQVAECEELPPREEYIHNIPTSGGRLDIIPSNISLHIAEINLRDEMGGEYTLKSLLEPLKSDYDFVVIDTNPSIGLLTINALAACDEVIIPVSDQLWSATGLTDLVHNINKVKRKINKDIEISGILLTICDERTKLYKATRELVEENYSEKINIFETVIPKTVKVGEANFEGKSIVDYYPLGRAAVAYISFAQEVAERRGA